MRRCEVAGVGGVSFKASQLGQARACLRLSVCLRAFVRSCAAVCSAGLLYSGLAELLVLLYFGRARRVALLAKVPSALFVLL